MGPVLLSRLLGLTKVQEGALNIVFRIADDRQMLLIDMKDLRSMLNYVSEHAKEYTTTYGNVSSQSVGARSRKTPWPASPRASWDLPAVPPPTRLSAASSARAASS